MCFLTDGEGAGLHLRQAEEGWVVAQRNPAGLYLYVDDVDGFAAEFAGEMIGAVEDKPWGMYEFAVSDPDGTLVRGRTAKCCGERRGDVK